MKQTEAHKEFADYYADYYANSYVSKTISMFSFLENEKCTQKDWMKDEIRSV